MHIEISAETRGGLRVLPELELSPLAVLEGYNGIGKSAAVRLLRICVGENPYQGEDNLWESFKAGLGPTTVIMTGLNGADRIVWNLDARHWPPGSAQEIFEPGEILIDGRPASVHSVRAILAVHRIVGNEGLAQPLMRQFAPSHAAIKELLVETGNLNKNLDALDEEFRKIEDAIGDSHQLAAVAVNQRWTECKEQEDAARTRKTEAALVYERLERAVDATQHLARIRGESGDLVARAENLRKAIASNADRLAELQKTIELAAKKSTAATRAEREHSKAEADLKKATGRIAEIGKDLADHRASARIDADAVIGDALAATRGALEEAIEKRERINTQPRLQGLADTMSELLRSAESEGLGEHPIISLPGDAGSLTVSELRIRLEREALRLSQAPLHDDVQAAEQRVRDLQAQVRVLDEASGLQRSLERALKARDDAQQKKADAARQLAANVGADDAKLLAEREELLRQNAELTERLTEVILAQRNLAGGTTEETLSANLSRLLDEAGITASELDVVIAKAAIESEQAQELFLECQQNTRTADAHRRNVEGLIDSTLRRMASDPLVEWLRSALPAGIPAEQSIEAKESFLVGLAAIIADQRAKIDDARQQARNLGAAFDAVEDNLRSKQVTDNPWVVGVRTWFGRHVSDWFQQAQVVRTLFGNGKDITLDIADMSIQWTIEEERRTRPLTAFSSGEQAFAYTRAQLGLLDESQGPANQIIALDEFGAYMAKEWLHRLEEYLQQRAARSAGDFTVLILPLTVTEEELRRQGESGSAQLAQLARRQYSIKDISTR